MRNNTQQLSICSGREVFVAVVQPTDLWERNHSASPRLDITRVGTMFIERW